MVEIILKIGKKLRPYKSLFLLLCLISLASAFIFVGIPIQNQKEVDPKLFVACILCFLWTYLLCELSGNYINEENFNSFRSKPTLSFSKIAKWLKIMTIFLGSILLMVATFGVVMHLIFNN